MADQVKNPKVQAAMEVLRSLIIENGEEALLEALNEAGIERSVKDQEPNRELSEIERKLAKQNEELEKRLQVEIDRRELSEIKAGVASQLSFLPKTVDEKAVMIKAMRSADPKLAADVEAYLISVNELARSASQEVGEDGSDVDQEGSALDEIYELADQMVKDKEATNRAKAISMIARSRDPEVQALYREYLAEQSQR